MYYIITYMILIAITLKIYNLTYFLSILLLYSIFLYLFKSIYLFMKILNNLLINNIFNLEN